MLFTVGGIWVVSRLLEPHRVVRSLVFVVLTHGEVGLKGGPWHAVRVPGSLSCLANVCTGSETESRLVFTEDEMRCFEIIHHFVGVVLIKLALVGLGSELPSVDRLLEARSVDVVSSLVFVLGRQSRCLVLVLAALSYVLRHVR